MSAPLTQNLPLRAAIRTLSLVGTLGLAVTLTIATPAGVEQASATSLVASKVGLDIDGEGRGDESGRSVSISGDGTRVAIGAPNNRSNTGRVRIYDWTGSSWTQVGADIDGEAANDYSGSDVSLSSDGSIVAIGAPYNDGSGRSNGGQVRVYKLLNGSWTQVGADIDGEAAGDNSGTSVALSSDGKRVAIGATGNDGNGADSGHVRVYGWNGTSWDQVGADWDQVGADIDGEAAGDYSGNWVALSDDGSRLAVGAFGNDPGGRSFAGHARVFDWNGTTWAKVGADIDGEAAGDYFGYSGAISSDGARLAIGASRNGSAAGHVRVFDWNGSSWTKVGADIDGEAANDQSGFDVSLSSDGSIVAIGAPYNDGSGRSNGGQVRVYKLLNGSWTQVGADIDGEAAGDNSGTSVALSSDGTRVAIGAPMNDGSLRPGHVRVFDFLLAPLTPTFGTTTGAPDGYTVQVLNYDASYGWNVSASAGSAAIDGAGLISVTGLGAGASSTIAVTTTRAGYGSGSANVVATALSSSLTPTFGAPVSTSDGYSVAVSNYDGSFGWAVTTSTGVGSLDSSGLISVTGLSPGAPATVTVDTTRSGYVPGSATVTGVALLSALTPTFGIPASTSDGFTVRVSNFDASHSWTVTASVGTGAIDSSGLITVVGLNAGSLSTVTVGSSRAGYQFGSASLTAGSNQAPAPNPAPPDPPESNPYSGPLFLSVQSAQAGDSVTYLGERLQLISAVSTGGTGLEILALSASELTLVIPATISPGVYDLLVISSEGRLTLLAGLEVFEAIPEPEAITPSIDEKRLTIGTFKGFIALYTKGYEGQKLSAKVAGKWLVVNPLKESWRQNNYSRTVRFTGAGYDIFVHLYIDGEFIKTELLTTK